MPIKQDRRSQIRLPVHKALAPPQYPCVPDKAACPRQCFLRLWQSGLPLAMRLRLWQSRLPLTMRLRLWQSRLPLTMRLRLQQSRLPLTMRLRLWQSRLPLTMRLRLWQSGLPLPSAVRLALPAAVVSMPRQAMPAPALLHWIGPLFPALLNLTHQHFCATIQGPVDGVVNKGRDSTSSSCTRKFF